LPMGIRREALGTSCRCAGQCVACQELGKGGGTLPAFTPSCATPAKVPLCPAASRCIPRTGCRGAVPGMWGAGFGLGCLLAICKREKRPGGGRGHPAPRGLPPHREGAGLGKGSPAAWHPQNPAVLLSLAPGPAGP